MSDKLEALQVNRKLDTLFSMRLNNEIEPEEFTQRKNDLLKEKAHFMDLLNDAQDRANTWLERAGNLFNFAKTAKTRFENGTITEKKEIIQALGSNLLLKDKTLVITLTPPFEVLKTLSPEVRGVNGVFEPVLEGDLSSKMGVGEFRFEIWLGIVRQLRTEYGGDIRIFREIVTTSNASSLMLKVA